MRHLIFLFQIISFKKYFYVFVGNNFLLFLWRSPSCGSHGQLPSLPSLKSGPANNITNMNKKCK